MAVRFRFFQYRLRTLFIVAMILAVAAYFVAERQREAARKQLEAAIEQLKAEAKLLEMEIQHQKAKLRAVRMTRIDREKRNEKMLEEHEGKPELFISDVAYEQFIAGLHKPIQADEAWESALLQRISQLTDEHQTTLKRLGTHP